MLTSTGNIDQGHIVYYRANKNDCSLLAKAQVYDSGRSQGHTRYRRGCTRPRPGAGQHRGLPAVTPRAQEDRDAICAYEAYLQARPASTARLDRCEGRGPAHSNRPEPEAARQVSLPSTAIGGGLSSIAGASGVGTNASMPQLPHRDSGTRNGKNTDDTALANTSEFCNAIECKADIAI